MEITDVSQLLTVPGAAAVIWVVIKLFVKDRLEIKYNTDIDNPLPRNVKLYRSELYTWAAVFGILIAGGTTLAIADPITWGVGIMGVVSGLFAALVAVGGNEVGKTIFDKSK